MVIKVKGVKMKQNPLKKHIELNDNDSSFTANATFYFGKASWNEKAKDTF